MTWFGPVSAWAAAATGLVALAFSAMAQVNAGSGISTHAALAAVVAALLLIASYRTLKAKSGGLRLLAGAWGFVAGLSLVAPSPYVVESSILASAAIKSWFPLACLALTVLHKEQKKPG